MLTVQTQSITSIGAGLKDSFDLEGIRYFGDDVIAVYRQIDGVYERLTYDVEYTLSGDGRIGQGRVDALIVRPVGEVWLASRDQLPLQTVRFSDAQRFPSAAAEDAMDRLVMAVQDLRARLARAMLAPVGATGIELLAEQVAALATFGGQLDAYDGLIARVDEIDALYAARSNIDAVGGQLGAGGVVTLLGAALDDVLRLLHYAPVAYSAVASTTITDGRVAVVVDDVNYVPRQTPFDAGASFDSDDWLVVAAGAGVSAPDPADLSFTGTFTDQAVTRGTNFTSVPLVVGLDSATAGFEKSAGAWGDVEFEVIQGGSRAAVERIGGDDQVYLTPTAPMDNLAGDPETFNIQVRARFAGQEWVESDTLVLTLSDVPVLSWTGDIPDQALETGEAFDEVTLIAGIGGATWGFSKPDGTDFADVEVRFKKGGSRLGFDGVGLSTASLSLVGISSFPAALASAQEVIVEARFPGGVWVSSAAFEIAVTDPEVTTPVPVWNGDFVTRFFLKGAAVSVDLEPLFTGATGVTLTGLPTGVVQDGFVLSGTATVAGGFVVSATPTNAAGSGETRTATWLVQAIDFGSIPLIGEIDLGVNVA